MEAEVAAHHGKAASKPTSGVARIAAERTRQILAEGWSTAHDRQHGAGELVSAACVYAMATLETGVPPIAVMNLWPWARTWWKPGTPVRNLEKAGALIAAEIDRLTLTDEATP
ncbi:hypothetical protein HBF32_05970 [Luteibacter yeojuensis]|uniref:Uncharacterized protein n=1 Tax=Luteibacter yeojuensis TaxID=345309 RepID=A0A7X5QTG2_9GAMM|nr:hypothetical protein [Luteibacter yeojuensis]